MQVAASIMCVGLDVCRSMPVFDFVITGNLLLLLLATQDGPAAMATAYLL